MRVRVKTYPPGEVDHEIELPDRSIAMDLFKILDLRPDSWIVVRGERVIPDDAELQDGDSLRLLSVVSGG